LHWCEWRRNGDRGQQAGQEDRLQHPQRIQSPTQPKGATKAGPPEQPPSLVRCLLIGGDGDKFIAIERRTFLNPAKEAHGLSGRNPIEFGNEFLIRTSHIMKHGKGSLVSTPAS
jgi:hypothetical protein